MMDDHLNQTQKAPPDILLGVLVNLYNEASAKAARNAATVRSLTEERETLRVELEMGGGLSLQSEQAEFQHVLHLTSELQEAQKLLEGTQYRVDESEERLREVKADFAESERHMNEKEKMLRQKLDELWGWLRAQAPKVKR